MKPTCALTILLFLLVIDKSPAETPKTGDAVASKSKSSKPLEESGNKISIVGAGNVGTAVALSLLTQYVTDEIVLIDTNENKVKGEVKDIQHGTGFIKSPKITGGTDYSLTKNSKICIVTAGVQQEGQEKLDLIRSNLKIFQEIVPKLVEINPNAVIIVVTSPVDIMTYITWRLAGSKNTLKIIGSGTNLDSSRLRVLMSQDLEVSPRSVHGWVVGEHGGSSVTLWSVANVAGVSLRQISQVDEDMAKKMTNGKDGEDWFSKINKGIQNSGYEVANRPGLSCWAIGLSVANIAFSIIHNVPNIHAVSTMVKGIHGINDEVFMSLPCVLGENGVSRIVKQPLQADELAQLRESATAMAGIINEFKGEI